MFSIILLHPDDDSFGESRPFLVATFHGVRRYRRDGAQPAIARYRKALGRTVLIGLEVLAAVTIIKTITLDPTL